MIIFLAKEQNRPRLFLLIVELRRWRNFCGINTFKTGQVTSFIWSWTWCWLNFFCSPLLTLYNVSVFLLIRYLEIVHPIWHKTHFKKKWLYISFAVIWPFGITLYAAFWIPTSKVSYRNLKFVAHPKSNTRSTCFVLRFVKRDIVISLKNVNKLGYDDNILVNVAVCPFCWNFHIVTQKVKFE